MKIALTYDYVMNALLGWAATHLLWMKERSLTGHSDRVLPIDVAAGKYKQIAILDLQNAIPTFNENNSDAILASSLLLAWQSNTQ